MQTQAWRYAVGALMILFGGCGIVKNVTTIISSRFEDISMYDESDFGDEANTNQHTPLYSVLTDSLTADTMTEEQVISDQDASEQDDSEQDISEQDASEQDFADKHFESIDKLFSNVNFIRSWELRFSYIGFIPIFIYIIAGIFLLLRKKFSVNLAVIAIALSILFSIIKGLVIASGTSGMGTLLYISPLLISIVIDVVLITMILLYNKPSHPGIPGYEKYMPR